MLSFVETIVPALAVAVVTSVVTVRLSIRQFRTERWWERKADVYSRIVESLYHAKRYYVLASRESMGEHVGQRKRELEREGEDALEEVRKATEIGAFIISDQAAKVLEDLERRPGLDWDSNPPFDVHDDAAEGYAEALAKIREIAKVDLSVR